MEKLTLINAKGEVCRTRSDISDKDAWNKLAEYENKIENGLMIGLPCKEGTPIVYIQSCQAPSCDICGCNNRYGDCVMEYKSRIKKHKFSLFFLKSWNESVFLTKSEAIAELERRANEPNNKQRDKNDEC